MPATLTIYLNSYVNRIDLAEVREGISLVDWHTIGEIHNLNETQVDEFLDPIIWTNDPLLVGKKGERPVEIRLYNNVPNVEQFAEEIKSEFTLPAIIQNHLKSLKTVVVVEIGIDQAGTMIGELAFEISCWLGESKSGVILDWDNRWYVFKNNCWTPLQ